MTHIPSFDPGSIDVRLKIVQITFEFDWKFQKFQNYALAGRETPLLLHF